MDICTKAYPHMCIMDMHYTIHLLNVCVYTCMYVDVVFHPHVFLPYNYTIQGRLLRESFNSRAINSCFLGSQSPTGIHVLW